MFRNLLVGLSLCLTGCIFVVPVPDDNSRSANGWTRDYWYEMWFNDADIYCEYDAADTRSSWTFIAFPDTSYGTDEIEDVYVDIGGSYPYTYINSFRLLPDDNEEWRVSFDNIGSPENSYHCSNHYEFEFIVYDYDGYYASTWVDW